jgi:hypothetical protein
MVDIAKYIACGHLQYNIVLQVSDLKTRLNLKTCLNLKLA